MKTLTKFFKHADVDPFDYAECKEVIETFAETKDYGSLFFQLGKIDWENIRIKENRKKISLKHIRQLQECRAAIWKLVSIDHTHREYFKTNVNAVNKDIFEKYTENLRDDDLATLVVCHGKTHSKKFRKALHLDINPACDPDILMDMTVASNWVNIPYVFFDRIHFQAAPIYGCLYIYCIKSIKSFYTTVLGKMKPGGKLTFSTELPRYQHEIIEEIIKEEDLDIYVKFGLRNCTDIYLSPERKSVCRRS